jgi:hypothetical protein
MAYNLGMTLNCDYCHKPIADHVHPFTLRLELFPAVEPSLQISERELQENAREDLHKLIEVLENMDDEEVARQEKLVYFSHHFTLCPACRHQMAQALERLLPGPGKS